MPTYWSSVHSTYCTLGHLFGALGLGCPGQVLLLRGRMGCVSAREGCAGFRGQRHLVGVGCPGQHYLAGVAFCAYLKEEGSGSNARFLN